MNVPTDQCRFRTRLTPGTVLRDTYTVVNHVGSGRFADAYLVRHRYMGLQVLKLLVDGLREEERITGLDEAFLLSRVSHPGIVRVFDANKIEPSLGGCPYITMEYVSGGTLEDHLAASPRGLELRDALEYGRQIASALGHAHQTGDGLIHRDVKPGNILLDPLPSEELAIRVADFGLACRANRFTQVAAAGGTVLYMSPESLRGYETPASDIFSAGIVLYEMLTGTLPYPGRAITEADGPEGLRRVLEKLQVAGLPAPSRFRSDIPSDVDAVVMRALHVDELFRYQSGVSLERALAACLRVQDAKPTGVPEIDRHRLAEVFRALSDPQSARVGLSQLEEMLRRDRPLNRVYGDHLMQMRAEWQRYRREHSQ